MYKTRKELKQEAKEALRGNWGWGIGVAFLPLGWMFGLVLLPALIVGAGSFLIFSRSFQSLIFLFDSLGGSTTIKPDSLIPVLLPLVFIGYFFVLTAVVLGTDAAFLDILKGVKRPISEVSFFAFKNGRFWKVGKIHLLVVIFLSLWSLLGGIPGIIKSYSYAMTNYILKERLEAGHAVTVTSSITESRRLMDGHKLDLFVLMLSFLGWYFLALFIPVFGMLLLAPYMRLTFAAFYKDLVKNSGETIVNDGDADSSADETVNTAIIS